MTQTFSELNLSPSILDTLNSVGFSTPTAIQAKIIPYVLQGQDVVACAQTGSGKTGSYVLPLLDMLKASRSRAMMPRCLVLVPTRELAYQVTETFTQFDPTKSLSLVTLIGGESIVRQEKVLIKGVDVVIATPGRFLDLVARGKILMKDVSRIVLDEADRMLDMGFIPDVEKVFSLLPAKRQVLILSATMPKQIQGLVKKFLVMPKEVYLDSPKKVAQSINQLWMPVTAKEKLSILEQLLKDKSVQSAFVFCNRKKSVDTIYKQLMRSKVNALCLHGDMSQSARHIALGKFRSAAGGILVASDVAARGLDVPDVTHVFNFDVPLCDEDYIHRIGRTGRAGKTGEAITLVSEEDRKLFVSIKKTAGNALTEIPLLAGYTPQNTTSETAENQSNRRGRPGRQKKPSTTSEVNEPQVKRSRPGRRKPATEASETQDNRSRPAHHKMASEPGQPHASRRAGPVHQKTTADSGMGEPQVRRSRPARQKPNPETGSGDTQVNRPRRPSFEETPTETRPTQVQNSGPSHEKTTPETSAPQSESPRSAHQKMISETGQSLINSAISAPEKATPVTGHVTSKAQAHNVRPASSRVTPESAETQVNIRPVSVAQKPASKETTSSQRPSQRRRTTEDPSSNAVGFGDEVPPFFKALFKR